MGKPKLESGDFARVPVASSDALARLELYWASCLGIEIRLLPRATPELNAMDTLWNHVKRDALGDRPTKSIDQSAQSACNQILAMTGHERLRQAGILSGNFWLTK